jgi:L-malate glycosyltransferase
VPIVSTPAGGIPHIVRHDETALLVPFDQPRAMADAILRVLREPGLATRLTTTGRSQVDRYTWTAAAAGWRAVYARATGRGHAIPVAAGHDRPIEAA